MPKRILVIDSDPSIRRSVSLFLRAEGYEVNEAKDGEAIARLENLSKGLSSILAGYRLANSLTRILGN